MKGTRKRGARRAGPAADGIRRGVLTTGGAAGLTLGGLLSLGLGFALALGAATTGLPRFDGIEDLPLPGGADLGDHPYTVTAELRDVLSLVPQSAVKVNDVAVGRVTAVELGDDAWSARVTMRINGDVRLPADATARLEQSSLLGEKYVQLAAPARESGSAAGTGSGRLEDGGVIPVSRTGRDTEVEEVFGALSLLLNGGGVNQLKTITRELNAALGGREPEVRSVLKRVNTLVTDLDENRGDITDALDAANRLSATLATRKDDVGTVLTDLSPGLKTLERQRGSLLTMLRSLDTLSGVAVSTIDASKDDMIADLKAIAPTLKALADAGTDLPDSLQVLLTYPFTDEVLRGVKGDYLNVYLDMTAVPGTQVIPPLVPQGTASPSAPADGGPAAAAEGPSSARTGGEEESGREPEPARSPGTPSPRRPAPEHSPPLPLPSVSASTASGAPADPATARGGASG
ncbi:MCE family protein [Streptomyces prasinopilosus]|uniref:Phospholipid/cholesterol/gamma-HCH transport system substrate-binding protein n=1 Tax=Streptomyces prasinopilosus TaxID=67344 RepID=A0A1G6J991_9ACTN|nr:MCE family protein [Streptomyces prasinopilosus]SDC14915.1 phospholipid/cholesterol/gamma-HCH transport system substrate-binding protein [Streptomyces prasinopilosus]